MYFASNILNYILFFYDSQILKLHIFHYDKCRNAAAAIKIFLIGSDDTDEGQNTSI